MKKLTENLIQQRLKTCTTDLDKVQQINVTGRELKDVSLLRKMTGVEILSLSVNHITTLVDFQDCKNLRELYLRQNKISNINEIYYLKNLPKLELLMLSQNPCADHPLYRMTVIKNLKNLSELDGVAITAEEKRQAQKAGEEVYMATGDPDPIINYISDGPQICRTPTQSIQMIKTREIDSEPDVTEPNIFKSAEEVHLGEVGGKKIVDETNLKMSPSCQLKMSPECQKMPVKKLKSQSPKPNRKQYNENLITKKSFNGPPCTNCGNTGLEPTHIGISKNSNILSAALSLLKELDYPGLQIINAEVYSRMNAFEVSFLCNRQSLPPRTGGLKET